jgi:elongation factor 2
MSVIAHVDHGKTTLTDSLIAFAGIIAGEKVGARSTDYDEEEKKRGITIKSTGVSMYYEIEDHEAAESG